MKLSIGDLSSSLPLVSIAGAIAALGFCGGVFRYIGYEIMASMTLMDLVAITWPLIPPVLTVAGFLGFQNMARGTDNNPITTAAESLEKGRHHGAARIVANVIFLVSPILLIWAFLAIDASNSFMWIFVVLLVIISWSIVHIVTPDRFKRPRSAIVGVLGAFLGLVTFGYGAAYGGYLVQRPANDYVTIDGTIKRANVVFLLEKGAVIRSASGSMFWLPNDRVKQVVFNVGWGTTLACTRGIAWWPASVDGKPSPVKARSKVSIPAPKTEQAK